MTTQEPNDAGSGTDWVGASGVSGEHVFEDTRTPKLHAMLMVLGPIGLAVAIVLSLWSSSKQVQHSVNVQVDSTWRIGEQLGVRAQTLGPDSRPLAGGHARSATLVDGAGGRHPLGELDLVDHGLSQATVTVPEDAALGAGALELSFDDGEPFTERIPIELVETRAIGEGTQVIAKHMLQWADDTDEQPEGVRIDVRPAGRLLAGFSNRVFVRVTDPAGKPWTPEHVPPEIQILLISGEFAEQVGKLDAPAVLYEGPIDRLGLAHVVGDLDSDVVRFEVRLREDVPPAPEDVPPAAGDAPPAPEGAPPQFTGPKRRLRFVSHAGTVRIHASTDLARPGETVNVAVEALSQRRPVYVDVHGPRGAWLDTLTPPLTVPQDRDWVLPERVDPKDLERGAFIQFEAYQSVLHPEDSSSLARVQLGDGDARAALRALVELQRTQLELPRIDKAFEIGREKAYLSHIEGRLDSSAAEGSGEPLTEHELARARAFLIGTLEAVVHGPPQALSTRAREEAELASFKQRWTVGIRVFLLGGGGAFILVMIALVWRNQREVERRTSAALGLGLNQGKRGESILDDLDDEAFADQRMAILHARRQVLMRGGASVVIMILAIVLTLAMLEALVWEY